MADEHASVTQLKADPRALEERALSLLGANDPGSDAFGEGLVQLQAAAEAGLVSAQIACAHVHLQHPTLADAPGQAHRWLERAARAGDPHAVERLADLYLTGYGVDADDRRACSLYTQLADYGFPSVLCHTAYLHSEGIGCEPDESQAATLVLRAAAQGHTLAFYLAAHRYAQGMGTPEDAAIGAAWMELAAARGFPSAEVTWQQWLDQLDEHSCSHSRELAERLKGNLRSLGAALRTIDVPEDDPDYMPRFNALVEQNYRELALPELDLDPQVRGCGVRRRPPRQYQLEACSWRPRVFRVPDFATAEERGHLLDLAQPLLRSTAETTSAGKAIEVDAFDGDCAIFAPYLTTPVIRNLLRRFALLMQIDTTHFEPMSVLRYTVGHEYSPHVDWFDGERMEAHRRVGDLGGQRIGTALISLVRANEGGETYYPASDTTVDGAPGTAIIHYNATPDGLADPDSVHHGRPIAAGEKWIARTAARELSLYRDFCRTR